MKSKLCWFSFYETEFGTESSHRQHKQRNQKRGGGGILGIPAGQFQKMGGLGGGKKTKFDFGKNKCTKRARGKKHNKRMKNKAQNFLQSTETKSKYPSLTW